MNDQQLNDESPGQSILEDIREESRMSFTTGQVNFTKNDTNDTIEYTKRSYIKFLTTSFR